MLREILEEKSNKTIITFGSSQLPWLKKKGINPLKVMLVIDKPDKEARDMVFKSKIGRDFSTSRPYDKYADKFKTKYNMKEYSLEDIVGK